MQGAESNKLGGNLSSAVWVRVCSQQALPGSRPESSIRKKPHGWGVLSALPHNRGPDQDNLRGCIAGEQGDTGQHHLHGAHLGGGGPLEPPANGTRGSVPTGRTEGRLRALPGASAPPPGIREADPHPGPGAPPQLRDAHQGSTPPRDETHPDGRP